MQLKKKEAVVRLTSPQAYRVRRMGERLWTEEDLSLGEISRRLLLEHLLWAKSEAESLPAPWERREGR